MRDLTPEECEFIAGGLRSERMMNEEWGGGPPVVITASPPPSPTPTPPPSPTPTPTPPSTPPTGGGGGGGDGGYVNVDITGAGSFDWYEQQAAENIRTATLNVQSMLSNLIDGTLVPIPAYFNLPPLSVDEMQAAALNIDFKFVLDDGINNGGVGSTQGTFANPLFVLETDGPTGVNGVLAYGQSLDMALVYVLHELAHLTPAAQQYYNQQIQAWRTANPGQPDSGFNNTVGWNNTEAFAWSIARSVVQASPNVTWTHQPTEGFLW